MILIMHIMIILIMHIIIIFIIILHCCFDGHCNYLQLVANHQQLILLSRKTAFCSDVTEP